MNINGNYKKLKEDYLFAEIAERVKRFQSQNPEKKVIRLGIGDVSLPLPDVVAEAMKKACEEMSDVYGFRGYGPYEGYGFLRQRISGYYQSRKIAVDQDEIFIGDGAKSDLGNFLDIFGKSRVLIPDPVYPVYLDTNIMAGNKIVLMDCNSSNGFLARPDDRVYADLIYLCSPNNPTGAVYDREALTEWVSYAIRHDSLILFDAAYEAFVRDETLPRSIFEIKGADSCAVEFCSLSKTAGFTGTRCGYTVIPKTLRDGLIHRLWMRRQSTKYNGVSYIVQRGAEAVFSEEGIAEITRNTDYYMQNAKIIYEGLRSVGIKAFGGENSPYIWLRCNGMSSWDFFDKLLNEANVVGTPGSGFGKNGEGYFRLTAFSDRTSTEEAVKKITSLLK